MLDDPVLHRPEISLADASTHDPGDVDAAVAIGNQSIATLGLLPVAAYLNGSSQPLVDLSS